MAPSADHRAQARSPRTTAAERAFGQLRSALDALGPGARITSVAPHPSQPRRLQLRSGRRVVAALGASLVEELEAAHGPLVGAPLTQRLAKAIAERVECDAARREALRRLNRRPLLSGRLRIVLLREGFSQEAVQDALEHCAAIGALDDEATARAHAEAALARQPLAAQGLIAALRRKGADAQLARSVAGELLQDRDELEDATAVALQRARALRRLPIATAQRRLLAYLQRRGFGFEASFEAVQRALGSPDEAS